MWAAKQWTTEDYKALSSCRVIMVCQCWGNPCHILIWSIVNIENTDQGTFRMNWSWSLYLCFLQHRQILCSLLPYAESLSNKSGNVWAVSTRPSVCANVCVLSLQPQDSLFTWVVEVGQSGLQSYLTEEPWYLLVSCSPFSHSFSLSTSLTPTLSSFPVWPHHTSVF